MSHVPSKAKLGYSSPIRFLIANLSPVTVDIRQRHPQHAFDGFTGPHVMNQIQKWEV